MLCISSYFFKNKIHLFNIYTVNALPVSNTNENISIKRSLSSLLNVKIPSFEDIRDTDISKIKVISMHIHDLIEIHSFSYLL